MVELVDHELGTNFYLFASTISSRVSAAERQECLFEVTFKHAFWKLQVFNS